MKALPLTLSLFLVAGSTSSFGATIVQTETFYADNAGMLYSGSDGLDLVDSTFFTSVFLPFDQSLGTLTSVEVLYTDFSVSGEGLVGNVGPTGTFIAQWGGVYYLEEGHFSGTGGAGQESGNPGDTLQATVGISDFTEKHLASEVGNSTLTALVFASALGADSFEVGFDTDVIFSVENMENLFVSTTGTISLVYDYDPIPEPSSSMLWVLFGIGLAVKRRRV